MTLPIFDAHQHFWDTRLSTYPWLCGETIANFRYGDYRAIRAPYLPEDYRRDTQRFRLAGSVYIEAEWDPRDPLGEMEYIAELRRREGLPSVAVGQAWLDRPDLDATLAELTRHAFVRGIRHKPRANAAPGMSAPGGMSDAAWRGGYARLAHHGLHFELQTPWWHLHEAAELARDHPDTRLVLNHTGLPADRSAAMLAAWRDATAELAQCDNAWVKISGLGQRGLPWTAEANGWIVRTTIELFGAGRCMFASNFPVDSLCATFDEIYDGFFEIVQDMSEADQRRLFHDNAVAFYAPA
ncbi:amidohydrolase family protein [Caballeronia sp. LZ034LL]|uniref:amidohydrolase family protein n=1 Tax=Caballeronia sp. LZ034LL TaxID=3038567 RepID=UPI002862962C|nr:amidohydrolase family protein [Caballeronia sp. LZ034LL]MDR5835770.1 amidohydrolase family protein [Caballeronia sp. LZ034LL]